MENHGRSEHMSSGRKRMEELREKKRPGVQESIRHARSTVFINIVIEAISALIFVVGVFYAIRFLNLRKPFMEPLQYRIIIGSFTVISIVWFGFLLGKVRKNVLRLREISRDKE